MPEDKSRSTAAVICWRCRARLSPNTKRCPRCYPEPPLIPEGEWVEKYRDGVVDE
jgi:ribosomal protein L40E